MMAASDQSQLRTGNATMHFVVLVLAVFAFLVLAPKAFAYDETGKSSDPANCALCHATGTVDVSGVGAARQGPHANYSTTSRNCDQCHSVHNASQYGYALLPGATLTETCSLCHDGTGGSGVYGAVQARGLTVSAAHRTETTSTVPGGDDSTGGLATATFTGANQTLSCGDCHSPHGASTVASFTTDRRRLDTDTAGFLSNELLRQKPTSAATATPVFGSDWCAGCHKGRASGVHDLINHPVEASGTIPGYFTYHNVQVLSAAGSTQTVAGSLGGSNLGYVMPWPRSAGQAGHKPICEQCHEDARHVGDVTTGTVVASEAFKVTTADGTTASDNPRFQIFPHESTNPSFLIETSDDLCTNCHPTGQLP